MITIVCFVLAASAGAVCRHVVGRRTPQLGPIPVGTLVVNLVGSLALGFIAGWDAPVSTVVGVAGLGALTTFSTFSADVVELRASSGGWTAAYIVLSVIGGVTMAWLGLRLP